MSDELPDVIPIEHALNRRLADLRLALMNRETDAKRLELLAALEGEIFKLIELCEAALAWHKPRPE